MSKLKTLFEGINSVKSLFWPNSERPKPITQQQKINQALSKEGRISNISDKGSISENYYDYMQSSTNRKDRYDTYDAMDEQSDVASVLDAYAEDATQMDHDTEHVVWVEGDDQYVIEELNDMLHTELKVDEWAEGCARDVSKYGDDFGRLVQTKEGNGISSIEWKDPRAVERIETNDGVLVGFEKSEYLQSYMQKVRNDSNMVPTYNPWDIVHFRLYKRKRTPKESVRNIYGTSLLVAAERPAKQVKILDDIMMIMRLTRAMDRHVYKIDIGTSPIEESVRILKSWKKALKRRTYIDPSSGKYDSRYDPMSFSEDVFFPTSEGNTSDITTIPGITNITDIADIDNFVSKLYGSLRAPKAFFGYEGEGALDKSVSAVNMKWARSVVGVQKAVKFGIARICDIHLALKGMESRIGAFKVMMVSPSSLEMLERLEAWQTLVDVADRLAAIGDTLGFDKRVWTDYIMKNVLWLSKQEIEMLLSTMEEGASNSEDDRGGVSSMGGFEPEQSQEAPEGGGEELIPGEEGTTLYRGNMDYLTEQDGGVYAHIIREVQRYRAGEVSKNKFEKKLEMLLTKHKMKINRGDLRIFRESIKNGISKKKLDMRVRNFLDSFV